MNARAEVTPESFVLSVVPDRYDEARLRGLIREKMRGVKRVSASSVDIYGQTLTGTGARRERRVAVVAPAIQGALEGR